MSQLGLASPSEGDSGNTEAIKLRNKVQHFNSGIGLPRGSDGKESACSAGDPGSIPELGRSLGEGHG